MLHEVTINHPGKKITGIKALRAISGMGLKEAKDAYEAATGYNGDKVAVLALDLPFQGSQRHIIEKGCEALGYNVTMKEAPSRPRNTGYWTLHWDNTEGRKPWTIEVLSAGGTYYYRESSEHQYLHELDGLYDDQDPGYSPIGAIETTREVFDRATNG